MVAQTRGSFMIGTSRETAKRSLVLLALLLGSWFIFLAGLALLFFGIRGLARLMGL